MLRTDGRTQPLIEMRERILKEEKEANWHQKTNEKSRNSGLFGFYQCVEHICLLKRKGISFSRFSHPLSILGVIVI